MAHLFAYGTLMCDDIMESVAGCLPEKKKALLAGYQRFSVKNEHYPGLVAGGDGKVEGIIYCNITEDSWRRLDSFEGEMYSRLTVEVELEDGSSQAAYVYIVKPEFENKLEKSGWSLENFLQKGKGGFIANYGGYREIR